MWSTAPKLMLQVTSGSSATETSALLHQSVAERCAFIDNAKYFFLHLVVLNHSLQDALDDGARSGLGLSDCDGALAHGRLVGIWVALTRALYLWCNLVAMPAFALLSGRATRSLQRALDEGDARGVIRRAREAGLMLWVYALFQVVTAAGITIVTSSSMAMCRPFSLLEPNGPHWYLFVLAVWRCATACGIGAARGLIPCLCVAALAVGAVDGGGELLQRLFTLAPFFFLGLETRAVSALAHFAARRRSACRTCGGGASAAIILALTASLYGGPGPASPDHNGNGDGAPLLCFEHAQRWAWQQRSCPSSVPPSCGALMHCAAARAAWAVTSTIAGVAALALVPAADAGGVTEAGRRTLYPYLLHSAVRFPLRAALASWCQQRLGGGMAALALQTCVALAYPAPLIWLLSRIWVRRHLWFVVEPGPSLAAVLWPSRSSALDPGTASGRLHVGSASSPSRGQLALGGVTVL